MAEQDKNNVSQPELSELLRLRREKLTPPPEAGGGTFPQTKV